MLSLTNLLLCYFQLLYCLSIVASTRLELSYHRLSVARTIGSSATLRRARRPQRPSVLPPPISFSHDPSFADSDLEPAQIKSKPDPGPSQIRHRNLPRQNVPKFRETPFTLPINNAPVRPRPIATTAPIERVTRDRPRPTLPPRRSHSETPQTRQTFDTAPVISFDLDQWHQQRNRQQLSMKKTHVNEKQAGHFKLKGYAKPWTGQVANLRGATITTLTTKTTESRSSSSSSLSKGSAVKQELNSLAKLTYEDEYGEYGSYDDYVNNAKPLY